MQTWILIIGGLVVLGIGLDLLRRMRSAGRDSYEMDLNMQRGLGKGDPLASSEVVEEPRTKPNPDFPNGGARKVTRDPQSLSDTGGFKIEPRIKTQAPLEDTQKIRRAPTMPTTPAAPTMSSSPRGDKREESETAIPMLMDTEEKAETTFSHDDDPFMSGSSPILSRPRVVPRKNTEQGKQEEGPREVIIINVMSRQPEGLLGARLLETVLSCGLRYGEMNIFHYHLSESDDSALFSMANIVKPGTFDLNNMQSFQTPGVSFFMSLPLPGGDKISAMETFDKMLTCAKKVAQNLNGELRDERRSVMTGQTVEHCRQRISEFSRLSLSRSGKFTSR